MSKELEALEEIRDFRYGKDKLLVCQTEMYNTLKQALQRLESIDNSKPSVALDCLERMGNYVDKHYDYWQRGYYGEDYSTIKQVLLNKSQKESAFEKIQAIIDTYYTSYIMDNESALRRIDKIIREVNNNE